ncbi:MAG TPA: molybdopterin-dependent oxidoreductase [Ktedonobacteraceae bacterium]|nr:molybdopterin-dependent oxidoreductase [Ktedonobacteraceae bacterium]
MQAVNSFTRKQRFGTGFLAGLIAGIVASILMLILSVTFNGVSLPEAAGAAFTALVPLPVFEYLHRTIGGDAKHYLFYGILVGQFLVFALSGGLCDLIAGSPRFAKNSSSQGHLHWLAGIILAFLLWLITGLIFLPVTGSGIFGSLLAIGMGRTMISLAVVGLVFGLLFVYIQNWLVQYHLDKQGVAGGEADQASALSRRTLIGSSLGLIGLGVLGVLAWRFITGEGPSTALTSSVQGFKDKIVPPPQPNYGTIQPVENLSAEVTSNDAYYIVSKNLFSDPVVDSKTWSLTVDGEVAHPFTLTYDELMALPRKQQYESMMCISNEVGGEYMSNALWEGVPLMDLLHRAGGTTAGATKVVLYSVDDYSDSIHLTKALEPTTLVAVKMNGVALPTGHGFPARLLVPGIYGMKHAKWLRRIQVVHENYQGYWQVRGWSDDAPIRMTARIDTPLTGSLLPANKPAYVAGVAFSGNKGISEVDVSLDGGHTWQKATLKRPLSNLTWVLWELPWQPAVGKYTVVARSIDMEGNVQDPQIAPPLPDGSTGYHAIDLIVQ